MDSNLNIPVLHCSLLKRRDPVLYKHNPMQNAILDQLLHEADELQSECILPEGVTIL